MSNNNANGHPLTLVQHGSEYQQQQRAIYDSRQDAIAKILKGRSPEIQSNVMQYMLTYNIDPDDEFFIVFVALGELETLIEKSPQQWKQLFTGFQGELKEWGSNNLEILKHLSHKAEIVEKLATNSENLSNSLIKFLDICEGLMSQLQKSNGLLTNSLSQLQASQTESKNWEKQTLTMILQLDNQIQQLNQKLDNPKVLKNNKNKMGGWKSNVMLFFLGATLLTTTYFNVNQSRVNQNINQRVQWLLEKANRQDCLAGIKKPDSPECRSLL